MYPQAMSSLTSWLLDILSSLFQKLHHLKVDNIKKITTLTFNNKRSLVCLYAMTCMLYMAIYAFLFLQEQMFTHLDETVTKKQKQCKQYLQCLEVSLTLLHLFLAEVG